MTCSTYFCTKKKDLRISQQRFQSMPTGGKNFTSFVENIPVVTINENAANLCTENFYENENYFLVCSSLSYIAKKTSGLLPAK